MKSRRGDRRLAFFPFELHPERARGLFPIVLRSPPQADSSKGGDDPVADYRPLLHDAGFDVLHYDQTPAWYDRLFTAYSAVIDAQDTLRNEMGEPATAAILTEMTLTLDRDIYSGRIFALARRHPN